MVGDGTACRHVVVGIFVDYVGGKVLISKRKRDQAGAGLWEFPGGKREFGETPGDALRRELEEELGIVVQQASPFATVNYRYPEYHIKLETWMIAEWYGEPTGVEGQQLEWVRFNELGYRQFPAANKRLIELLVEEFRLM